MPLEDTSLTHSYFVASLSSSNTNGQSCSVMTSSEELLDILGTIVKG